MNTDNDLETLAPCPCGKVPECLLGRHYRQVACRRCGRRGPLAESEWLAVKLWNNERMIATLCEWQPIETAPKDGSGFLVSGVSGQIDRAFFIPPDAGIGNELALVIVGGKYEPTHWMPLPDPPKHKFQSMHGTDSCWHCDSDYGLHEANEQ